MLDTSWSLRVWGQVRESVEWSRDEVLALPQIEARIGLKCSSKDLVLEESLWRGLGTRELLARVIPLPDVTYVMAHGPGDFRAGFSLATFARPNAILAWSRNQEPLSPKHGGPLRLVVPSSDLCKSVKAIEGLEFLNKPWPDMLDMK
jgi:DMSO/TMAO reductase YedYZ molybdopterin-dependent catalytic subunit